MAATFNGWWSMASIATDYTKVEQKSNKNRLKYVANVRVKYSKIHSLRAVGYIFADDRRFSAYTHTLFTALHYISRAYLLWIVFCPIRVWMASGTLDFL